MRRFLTLITSYFIFVVSSSATAQIVPDSSLPNNSVVSDDLEITGGTTQGNNLFHSFREFSLSTGQTAFFNNDLAIDNIISRVTGNSVSAIDGLIRSLGDANLFLINPNGIIFGNNAALDVGGSFISSTANSIQFADGSEFSAIASDSEPLLTVSIPVGLQYGSNAGDITVEGTGNNLSIDFATFTVDRSDRPVGLSVDSGSTLALIGGNVFLPGGNLTATGGKVAIGSVADAGLVTLSPDELGWNFNYDGITTFGAINLSQAASVEVSGDGGGAVRFQGKTISISDGSAILADTLGENSGRVLEISATESIELIGSATDNFFPTRLSTDVDLDATGNGGNLLINTDYLLVADGAQVNSSAFGLGDGGNITVKASEIEVIGESFDGEFASGLFAQADFGDTGDGGDLTITTDYLLVDAGAQISTTTFGSGDAGNISVTASEIELIGAAGEFASGLFTNVEAGSSGKGGDLQIVTDYLLVTGGARIATNTFSSGNTGNINVTASEMELIGGAAGVGASGLFANVEAGSSGKGGDLQIVTDYLLVTGGARIATNTFGSGDTGNLNITASEMELIGGAAGVGASGLFANVEPGSSGNSGNLNIETNNLLITNGAQIATATRSIGGVGAIDVDSQEISLMGTSPSGNPSGIFANVIGSEGAGGNIAISTTNLNLSQGAQISTSTSGSGDGGDLEIIASNSILVNGTSEFGSSGLFANAVENDGSGGNITVNTNFLSLVDGATISVSNFPSSNNSSFSPGEGAAGNINLIAAGVFLNEQATITANTFTGDRGNINLQTDLLLLRRGSQISTDAQKTATGGNITIDVSDGFLVAIPEENSDITANAVFGNGGQVNISVLEIFGIQPRDSLTPFSDITATSEFGIAGSVVLNTQDLNPNEDLTELPNALKPQQLAQGCQVAANNNSSFVNLGQGGLNPQANDALGSDELIGDVQLPRQWKDHNEIVEARSWLVNEEGKLELIADIPNQFALLRCQEN